MLERNVIQGRGFRNVVEGGQVTGFQFDLRNPNYRGGWASLVDGVEVIIDGEKIESHVPLWTLQAGPSPETSSAPATCAGASTSSPGSPCPSPAG